MSIDGNTDAVLVIFMQYH